MRSSTRWGINSASWIIPSNNDGAGLACAVGRNSVLRRIRGASMVEYVVLVVLLIALIGAALLGLSVTISQKLYNVYVDLGS